MQRIGKAKRKHSSHLVTHGLCVDDAILGLRDASDAMWSAVDVLGIPKEVGLAVGRDACHQSERIIHIQILKEAPDGLLSVLVGIVCAEEGPAKPCAVA